VGKSDSGKQLRQKGESNSWLLGLAKSRAGIGEVNPVGARDGVGMTLLVTTWSRRKGSLNLTVQNQASIKRKNLVET